MVFNYKEIRIIFLSQLFFNFNKSTGLSEFFEDVSFSFNLFDFMFLNNGLLFLKFLFLRVSQRQVDILWALKVHDQRIILEKGIIRILWFL